MKYLLVISYDGKNFYGWNKQPNLRTIHQTLEDGFTNKFDEVNIKVSGRTDRFAHSLNQTCEINLNKKITKREINEINHFLNKEIKIKKIKKVNNEFSARFSLKNKTYLYKINNDFKNKITKDENYYLNIFREINLSKLKNDAMMFIGEKNFASFTSRRNYENYVRKINYIKIKKRGTTIEIEINGNGFLRFMVRHIIGCLLAKNFDKISNDKFLDLFNNPKKGKNIYKVTAHGLYLKKVKY